VQWETDPLRALVHTGLSRPRGHDFYVTDHVEVRHMNTIASILSVTLLLTGSGALSLLVTYGLLTLILRTMIFFWVSPFTHDFVLTAKQARGADFNMSWSPRLERTLTSEAA